MSRIEPQCAIECAFALLKLFLRAEYKAFPIKNFNGILIYLPSLLKISFCFTVVLVI